MQTLATAISITNGRGRSASCHTLEMLDRRVAAAVDDCYQSPLWRAVANRSTPDDLAAALLRELYWDIHCYHPSTTPAGFGMIGRIAPQDKRIMRALLLHKWEEVEHRVWALDCYKALGGDMLRLGESQRMSPAAFAVAAVWERLAYAVPPLAYLGAEYLFEELTARIAKEAIATIGDRNLPAAGLRFIVDHATEDQKHSAILKRLINSATARHPELHDQILFAFDCFRQVYPLPVWLGAYDRAIPADAVDFEGGAVT